MDLGSAIIAAVVIVITILPFIFISRSRKKREKQMLQSLTNIAKQHNCNVTQYEIYTDFAIGLDDRNNNIFFFKKSNETSEYINLADIQSCRVINTSKPEENNDENYKATERLILSFIPIAKNKQDINLEFYNAEKSIQLIGHEELQTVEKWSKIINDRLKSK